VRIENGFTVALPPDRAFELLLDLERVAPCLPGAELRERREDGSYAVAVKVRLGPMRFTYDGSVSIAEQDATTRRAVLAGEAREIRGQGNASATIEMTVEPSGAGSSVRTAADLELTGRAAQMGHGMIATVAEQLLGEMARCIEDRFEAEAEPRPAPEIAPAAEPVRGIRLMLRALVASARRLFRRAGRT
jgi:carbon monoxide dehydrogenase subunit G